MDDESRHQEHDDGDGLEPVPEPFIGFVHINGFRFESAPTAPAHHDISNCAMCCHSYDCADEEQRAEPVNPRDAVVAEDIGFIIFVDGVVVQRTILVDDASRRCHVDTCHKFWSYAN